MSERVFTSQEVTDILAREFAAPLIITVLGSILYGIDCYKFLIYIFQKSEIDPPLTKVYVSLVMILTTASAFFVVYFDWSYSITGFTKGATSQLSHVNGYAVLSYSLTVMLVQLFWLVVLDSAVQSQSSVWRWGIYFIALSSIGSFVVAVSVAACSAVSEGPNWPDKTTSILLRFVLGLDLGVDSAILVLMLIHLNRMRREFREFDRAFSSLSYIFCGTGLISTMIVILELIINFPRDGNNTFIQITITFFPVLAPLYSFAMLSVLNSRGELRFEDFESSTSSSDINENQRPQMNFTNDETSAAVSRSRAAAAGPDSFREQPQSRNGLNERRNQKRFCKTRLEKFESQMQSTEVGVQTI